ncbi:TniQ family protein [Streptomyces violens]|uniref:TniQ family protein n=1 Tax=Streptomyces violens TaxID=66377 RepID=UPI0012FEDE05|nr:TniQ family protein [Streptomyces violens]
MAGRAGVVAAGRRKVWRPAQRLARSVRFIGGESTGSYVRRLANANGIPDEELWAMFGAPLRRGGGVGDPQCSEGYLNRAALEQLAVLSGREVAALQCALPNLRTHRLLPADGAPAWDWPWDADGCFLVRVCELCARVKGTSLEAYLAAEATWQVCARHGRWLDNRRGPGDDAVALSELPEVVEAHRMRLLLERRLGAGGRAMFADAYAIASCRWNVPDLNAPVWRARRRATGWAGDDELRVAPLMFSPEAVGLAQALAARERQRLRGTLTQAGDRAWHDRLAKLLTDWGIPAVSGMDAVGMWAGRHSLLPPPRPTRRGGAQRPTRGRYRRLPLAAPHTGQMQDAVLGDRSCLRWKLGDLITAGPPAAPDGWCLGGRA